MTHASAMVGWAIALAGVGGTADAAARCTRLPDFTAAGHSVVIRKTEPVAATADAPAHCRVDGVIDQRTGRDGKPYGIGFAVSLPASWNGNFLFQGGGGLNGSVQPPTGAAFAGGRSALARGFAVASTDSGHQATGFDATFLGDQQAALNFLSVAVAETTQVARQIVMRHYGKPAARAYFVGCSTGGREAMMMSQRYPQLFDGIVAGAPAMRTSFSNLGLRSATTALNAIAPLDEHGAPKTREALSDGDRRLIVDALLARCDPLDGREDGFISAPHRCDFDPGTLTCPGAKSERCLGAAQVNAVRTVMNGPRTAAGRQVYPGYWYDTGIGTTRGLRGILAGPLIPEGKPAGVTMDVDAAAADAMDARAMVGDTNAWTNLSTFKDRGGKLLFFHGVSDPWFSAQDTTQYYQRLGNDNPGPLEDWSRLFLVPGMGHCGGGEHTLDSFDMLGALVAWVETGSAPDRVIATGKSSPGESRPLCPFPRHAQYHKGDAREATSYDCMN